MASTLFFRRSIPSWAFLALTLPSDVNGFVTTAMVSAPSSLAHCAATGAAPVPVPPPSGSDQDHVCARQCFGEILLDSSAACSPTSVLHRRRDPWSAFHRSESCYLLRIYSKPRYIGIDCNKFDPFDLGIDHAVDCIISPPPTPITLMFAISDCSMFAPPSGYFGHLCRGNV